MGVVVTLEIFLKIRRFICKTQPALSLICAIILNTTMLSVSSATGTETTSSATLVNTVGSNEIGNAESPVFDQLFNEDFIGLFLRGWFPRHEIYLYKPSLPAVLLAALNQFRNQRPLGNVEAFMLDQIADTLQQLSPDEPVDGKKLTDLLMDRKGLIRGSWTRNVVRNVNLLQPLIARETCFHSRFDVAIASDLLLRIQTTDVVNLTLGEVRWSYADERLIKSCSSPCPDTAAEVVSLNPLRITITQISNHPELSLDVEVQYAGGSPQSMVVTRRMNDTPAGSASIILSDPFSHNEGTLGPLVLAAEQIDQRNGTGTVEADWERRLLKYFDSLSIWNQGATLLVPIYSEHPKTISCAPTEMASG